MTNRTVEPYRLVLKEISWYLQAFCTDKKEFRTFKLSRMSELKVLPESFIPREFTPQPLGTDHWVSLPFITIHLKIHSKIKDQLVDKFGDLNFSKMAGNSILTVDFPFVEDEFGYNLLLGFGKNCEVLKPPHVRAELKRRIHELATFYD